MKVSYFWRSVSLAALVESIDGDMNLCSFVAFGSSCQMFEPALFSLGFEILVMVVSLLLSNVVMRAMPRPLATEALVNLVGGGSLFHFSGLTRSPS